MGQFSGEGSSEGNAARTTRTAAFIHLTRAFSSSRSRVTVCTKRCTMMASAFASSSAYWRKAMMARLKNAEL